ncbi:hypothetical protein R3P38DRAFT_2983423, partial [Favolaschia claudopus]
MASMEKVSSEEGTVPVDTPGDEPCAKIWSVYTSEAEKYDQALADSWRRNMNGMLIFTGLFSAILTTFIVESYKTLQPDTDTLSAYAAACSAQLALTASNSFPPDIKTPLPCDQFTDNLRQPQDLIAPLACNILWFISLGLSLASALIATLVEQWSREFVQRTDLLPSPVKRARIFAYLYYGLQRFRMHAVVSAIPLLLHLSLLCFFGGLIAFLFPVNNAVAYVAAALLAIIAVLYTTVTVLPLVELDCPYRTPLSNIFWNVRRYFLKRFSSYELLNENDLTPTYLHRFSMINAMIRNATVRSNHREARDTRALAWTMKSLADDDELEPFVEGIPSAIWGLQGRRRKYDNLIRGLLTNPQVLLGYRIEHLMQSCESGLLEPMVKTRREISCLKAIWCIGMMSEKGVDREDPSKELDPLEPPPPTPDQPLNSFQGLRFLPPKNPGNASYLSSIAALADWNNLCSLYGHAKRLTASLQRSEGALADGKLPDLPKLRHELEDFLAERRRCKWAYLIPITYMEHNLEELLVGLKTFSTKVAPLTLHSATDWLQNVTQIVTLVPTSFNAVQHRVLLTYLQQCTDLDGPPYEFDLTVQTLQRGLEPIDIPVGLAVATFCDNARKAAQSREPRIIHNDLIFATILPWFEVMPGSNDPEMLQRVTDSGVEYINKRGSNEAICRALRDCNMTRHWERVISRLPLRERPDLLGDYSQAIWHLASLFPGLSTPEARLPTWPRFNASTLSITPAPTYSASILALLKTHILNSYDRAYQSKELQKHLDTLQYHLTANERPSASPTLLFEVRRTEDDWGLITAVCSLLLEFPTMGTRPLLPLDAFPSYTIQTYHAYREWRQHALDAANHATELLPRLDRRMEEARLAIASEFLKACSDDGSASDCILGGQLPNNAMETFDSLSPGLFVSRPPHPDNQRSFASAFCSLAEVDDPKRKPLLQAVISSPLFNDAALPWLDDPTALAACQKAVQMLQTSRVLAFDGDGLSARRLDDIWNWLDTKAKLHPTPHPP